jgi:hypothetical protein
MLLSLAKPRTNGYSYFVKAYRQADYLGISGLGFRILQELGRRNSDFFDVWVGVYLYDPPSKENTKAVCLAFEGFVDAARDAYELPTPKFFKAEGTTPQKRFGIRWPFIEVFLKHAGLVDDAGRELGIEKFRHQVPELMADVLCLLEIRAVSDSDSE